MHAGRAPRMRARARVRACAPRRSAMILECRACRLFFRECVALADDDRDVDLYHWSSTRFSRAWFDSLSVLVARGRAKVSAAAAASDWPKRIRDMQHIDAEDLD